MARVPRIWGFGTANIAAGVCQGFAESTGGSRTGGGATGRQEAADRPDRSGSRCPATGASPRVSRRSTTHRVRRPRLRWVIVQCEAITDIDISAAQMRPINGSGPASG
jgi:hypothetical protein